MKHWLVRAIIISLCLVSCAAKSAPTRITVKAADAYSGSLHLDPCAKEAQGPVPIDGKGNGSTSACPMVDDVEIVVVEPSRTIYVAPERIKIARAGDGFPVTIDAVIPSIPPDKSGAPVR